MRVTAGWILIYAVIILAAVAFGYWRTSEIARTLGIPFWKAMVLFK